MSEDELDEGETEMAGIWGAPTSAEQQAEVDRKVRAWLQPFMLQLLYEDAHRSDLQAKQIENPWGKDVSAERRAELEAALQQWSSETDHSGRRGPFDGDSLTGADVFWLAARTLGGSADDDALTDAMDRLLRAADDVRTRVNLDHYAVHLEGADLRWVRLEQAVLPWAHLEGADLYQAHLEGADFRLGHLEGAGLENADLKGAILSGAYLEGADFIDANLEEANFQDAHLEGAYFIHANLRGASVLGAHLEGAEFNRANLEGAILNESYLGGKSYSPNGSDYQRIHQWTPEFPPVLPPTDLRLSRLDATTTLVDVTMGEAKHGYARVADMHWGGANLTVIDWTTDMVLGDERAARDPREWEFQNHTPREPGEQPLRGGRDDASEQLVAERLALSREAVRANRQLATILRDQGLNEESEHFAYRAQLCQRIVLRLQHNFLRYTGSLFLDLIAGYGYRLGRIFVAYALIVLVFAAAFLASEVISGQALFTVSQVLDALQISLNAIHGRVFFAQFHLDTLQSWLATAESIFGIVIEGVFVAMLIQQFFSR